MLLLANFANTKDAKKLEKTEMTDDPGARVLICEYSRRAIQ